jgi:hypothetical protein
MMVWDYEVQSENLMLCVTVLGKVIYCKWLVSYIIINSFLAYASEDASF